jgi:hypothetical protein
MVHFALEVHNRTRQETLYDQNAVFDLFLCRNCVGLTCLFLDNLVRPPLLFFIRMHHRFLTMGVPF